MDSEFLSWNTSSPSTYIKSLNAFLLLFLALELERTVKSGGNRGYRPLAFFVVVCVVMELQVRKVNKVQLYSRLEKSRVVAGGSWGESVGRS